MYISGMIISNIPTAEALTATKFGAGVTFNNIAKANEAIAALGKKAFEKQVALGGKLIQVKTWWKMTGKAEWKEADYTTNWDEAVTALTGLSRGWFNKLCRAFEAAEAQPDLFAEYMAAEASAEQALNVERWLAYVKDDAETGDAEVREVREAKEATGKYLGQLQVSGACPAVRLTPDGQIETEASEDDIKVALEVFRGALLKAGMKKAAAAIKPLKDEALVEEVAGWLAAV